MLIYLSWVSRTLNWPGNCYIAEVDFEILFLVLIEIESLYIALASLELCRPDWPPTYIDRLPLPAS